ncbi:MAG: hypothetical protein IPH59_11910 [bacterium]|nr:hypothetical protein [bacterium]
MTAQSLASSEARSVSQSVAGIGSGGGGPVVPTIEFVAQAAAAGPNGGTTPAIDATTATLAVVVISYYGTSNPTVSDSEGNIWTPLVPGEYSAARCRMYYCYLSGKSATHTFTAGEVPSLCAMRVLLFKNALGDGFDIQEHGEGGSLTTLASGLLTPAVPKSLFVSALCNFTETIEPTYPVEFIGLWTAYSPGNYLALGMAYKIATDGAAINPSWAWTSGNNAAAVGAVFKPQS